MTLGQLWFIGFTKNTASANKSSITNPIDKNATFKRCILALFLKLVAERVAVTSLNTIMTNIKEIIMRGKLVAIMERNNP